MNKEFNKSWVWRYMPVIPVFRCLTLEDQDFEASLAYRARSCSKNKITTTKEKEKERI
jgi:hypothetical protein